MVNRYSAIVLKPIYWHGESFKEGDSIILLEADMHILFQAGVIGNMKKIVDPVPEQAIREAPENEMRPFHRKARL